MKFFQNIQNHFLLAAIIALLRLPIIPQNFNDLLQEQLSNIIRENKEIIILGDCNVNFNNSASNDFKLIINQIGLKQIIKQSTRITRTSLTHIDLIMTNRPSNISKACVVASSLSDHDIIACNRKINAHKLEPKIINCCNYANYNMDRMNEDLSKINWQPIYNCKNVCNALNFFAATSKMFLINMLLLLKRESGEGSICG